MGVKKPKFSIWQIFLFFQNLVKSTGFWTKSKNFSWKFLKISQNIFLTFFCKKKVRFFLKFLCFRVFLLKKKKHHWLINHTSQVRSPVKQVFFVSFPWPNGGHFKVKEHSGHGLWWHPSNASHDGSSNVLFSSLSMICLTPMMHTQNVPSSLYLLMMPIYIMNVPGYMARLGLHPYLLL